MRPEDASSNSSSRCRALGPTPCPGASVSSPGLRFASADAEWGLQAVSISARRSRRLVQVSGAGRRCRWPLEFARRSSGCGRARPRAEGSVCIFVEGSKGRGHSGRGHPVRGLPKVEDETKGQTKGLGAQSAGWGRVLAASGGLTTSWRWGGGRAHPMVTPEAPPRCSGPPGPACGGGWGTAHFPSPKGKERVPTRERPLR